MVGREAELPQTARENGHEDKALVTAARRALAAIVYRSHVWFGVVTAVGVIAVCLTGIYLNHLNDLGFWRPPEHESAGSIEDALSIRQMIILGLTAAHDDGLDVNSPRDVNRLTYRPSNNTVSVRFLDGDITEAVLDGTSGEVLQVAPRDDVTIEHLHTGEVLGQRGVILSDIIAGALVVLTLGGVWLWLNRLFRAKGASAARRGWWLQLNRSVHLIAGLVVAVMVILLSVTGVLLNHKRELGYMEEPYRPYDYEPQRREPIPLSQIANIGISGLDDPKVTIDDIWFIDFRPPMGYAKVRFRGESSKEVIVDVYDGDILNVSNRRDFFIEELHAGELLSEEFGGVWGKRLVDISGAVVILLTLNGLYLWIRPAWSGRSRAARDGREVDEVDVEEIPE